MSIFIVLFVKPFVLAVPLNHLKGVRIPETDSGQAEIIPNEPGQVMLPRDGESRNLEFLRP